MVNDYTQKTEFDRKTNRFFVYLIVLSLLVVVVVGRYFYLMVLVPASQQWESIELPSVERGSILDRNGKILAISTKLDSVSAWMPNVKKVDETALRLSQILDLDSNALINKLRSQSGFVYIKRKITPTESLEIQRAKEAGEIQGISLTPEYGRNYPHQELASHVIGYVSMDNIGLSGIEYTFNQVLSPPLPLVAKDVKYVHGNQVFLTIDINVQYIIENAAFNAYNEHKADSVMILVMDAQNGDILGYSSIPRFDPNEFTNADAEALINRPATFAYEPGSVFKIFSIASFLQLEGISLNSTFNCNGFYEYHLANDESIQIKCLGVHGEVNPGLILQKSCNAGAAYSSELVTENSLYQMLLLFGFGKPTELFSGETSGILRKPSHWSARTKATIAFGQEISISALQILTAATVFTNGGILLTPHIVKKIVTPDGKTITAFLREPKREVLSPEIAQSILGMMVSATEDGGTARRARIDGINISAKTGTAQVYDSRIENYSEDHFVASFLGILPTESPRFIIYVVINYPRGETSFGGRIAAPVFKQIAQKLISYYGIPYGDDAIIVHSGEVPVDIPDSVEIGTIMPDLTGIPKRSLLSLFSNEQIEVYLKGEGYVVKQDPDPGVRIEEGTKIILELE